MLDVLQTLYMQRDTHNKAVNNFRTSHTITSYVEVHGPIHNRYIDGIIMERTLFIWFEMTAGLCESAMVVGLGAGVGVTNKLTWVQVEEPILDDLINISSPDNRLAFAGLLLGCFKRYTHLITQTPRRRAISAATLAPVEVPITAALLSPSELLLEGNLGVGRAAVGDADLSSCAVTDVGCTGVSEAVHEALVVVEVVDVGPFSSCADTEVVAGSGHASVGKNINI